MTDNEFLLEDRLQKIRSTMRQYGIENFAITYSGGKDSTVLHELFDMAIQGNKIPRVYVDTGIEYNMMREFVKKKAEKDERIIMIKPQVPVKKVLETEGYPFKSKDHSEKVERYNRVGMASKSVRDYANRLRSYGSFNCPKSLYYQFTHDGPKFKISDKCCLRMKEEPINKWQKEHNKPYAVIGLMASEGGAAKNRTMPGV